jgi:chromosome segregation ATPase
MTDIVGRSARTEIAALQYAGPASITTARELRDRMAATVDLARRARIDAREHMWNAREAERALGRMIATAREVGDLADGMGRPDGVDTLDTIGISRDLAALSTRLAKVPDDHWSRWHEQDIEPTQRAIDAAAREYERNLNMVAQQAEGRRAQERRLREEAERIEQQLGELANRAAPIASVPALRDDETDTSSAGLVAPATAVEEPVDDRDRQRGDAWLTHLRAVEQVITVLQRRPPELPHDRFADLTVLTARDLARRITDAAAIWVRAVNASYDERIGQS